MTLPHLVSIVVNNYNYGRFLGAAIDSALQQHYPKVEVIVVDDGSTDCSREVAASYGDRIITVLKDNEGQASAFNAGFARSRGELVIFLDADDTLLPDVAARAAATFQAHPELGVIQFRLELMNAAGVPTGILVPPEHVHMANGDLREKVQLLTNNTWWSPTSGNAFSRRVLQQVLPMPTLRYSADYYLSRASALCAPVTSLGGIAGYYRFHGANSLNASVIDLDKLRARIVRIGEIHKYLRDFALSTGNLDYPAEPQKVRDVMFLAERMTSLKLAPREHPIPEDTRLSLLRRGCSAALARVDVAPSTKLVFVAWFIAMFFAPVFWSRWLVSQLFFAHTRLRLPTKVFAFRHLAKKVKAL